MMNAGENRMKNRPAAVAGKFYPASGKELRSSVEGMLKAAKPPVHPEYSPVALVVPHAGYIFSGESAASAYNQIVPGDLPGRVFIIASSHHIHFPGASVYCSGEYETPLGIVRVDQETCRRLAENNDLFSVREDAHLFEHSIEVQLPFLQFILDDRFRFVPIILGTHRDDECKKIAEALEPFFISGNLFIFSSDFSHYPCYDDAVRTDRLTTQAIMENSPGKLLSVLEKIRGQKIEGLVTSLCGWTSVLVMLNLTTGKELSFEWIDYRNSGDQSMVGDHDRVVGYSSIAVYNKTEDNFNLNEKEKETLLRIAGESVRMMVISGEKLHPAPGDITGTLQKQAGAFVSIYVDGKLRGCIGSFCEGRSLAEVVCRMAASATNDRRFSPVEKNELDRLTIEISVLTPLKKIKSADEIILGKHGIYIKKGWSSGTFLPQVALKYGFTLDEFLGRCSRDKAGIGWDGWKTAELYTYEAIVFSNSQ
jgi:AmmeMemoRadiSam system protein B/AmmeMemoRadiSam system protein A